MSTALLSIIMMRPQVILDDCKKHMCSEWGGVGGFVFIRVSPPPELKQKFFLHLYLDKMLNQRTKMGQITPEFHEPMNFLSILIKFLITYIQHVTILNNLQQINKMPIQSDQWTPPPPS